MCVCVIDVISMLNVRLDDMRQEYLLQYRKDVIQTMSTGLGKNVPLEPLTV